MDIRLDNKVAIVTGSGTGIGRGIALQLARCGADIAVIDINYETASRTAQEISSLGAKSIAIQTDVSKSDQVEKMVLEVIRNYGQIDILCNNAGISQIIKLVDMTEDDWDRMLNINTKGVFLCSKFVVPYMIQKGKGRIINTASYLGKIGARELTHYCASKFAVVGFTQSLAHELAPYGILVTAVGPGDVDTEMMAREWVWEAEKLGITPEEAKQRCEVKQLLGRLEKPEDIAYTVAFLASDYASYTTGVTYNVSGGLPLTA